MRIDELGEVRRRAREEVRAHLVAIVRGGDHVDVGRRAELVRDHERDRDRDQHRHQRDAALTHLTLARCMRGIPAERRLREEGPMDEGGHGTKLSGSCIRMRASVVSLYVRGRRGS